MFRRLASFGAVTCLCMGLVACSDPAPPAAKSGAKAAAEGAPEGTKTPSETPSADGPVLTLGAAKIMREGHPERAIEIEADGKVTLAGIPFGILSADGRLLSPGGELTMTVAADGSVAGDSGPSGIALDASGGSLDVPDLKVQLRFEDDGSLVTEATGARAHLLGPDGPQLRSEGCEGPVRRACALITLSYLMALGNPDSPEAP